MRRCGARRGSCRNMPSHFLATLRVRRRHAVFLLIVAGLIGAQILKRWFDGHPFVFRAPPDATQAFAWDTTPEIFRRGSCGPGSSTLDPDWRPQPGRYLLTMLIADGPTRWRRIHGRLWLHTVDVGSAPQRVPGPATEKTPRASTLPILQRNLAACTFKPMV